MKELIDKILEEIGLERIEQCENQLREDGFCTENQQHAAAGEE